MTRHIRMGTEGISVGLITLTRPCVSFYTANLDQSRKHALLCQLAWTEPAVHAMEFTSIS
jgi:hypothetical protein